MGKLSKCAKKQNKSNPKRQFRKLQASWYAKLAETGFIDCEVEEELIRFHSFDFAHPYRYQSEDQFKNKELYYLAAKELLARDIFLSPIEKRIWQLHATGQSIRKIVQILDAEDIAMNKNDVNRVINEFQDMIK